jgi:cyclohexanecarboxylate-CoA ligase
VSNNSDVTRDVAHYAQSSTRPVTLIEAFLKASLRTTDTRMVIDSDIHPHDTQIGDLIQDAIQLAGALQDIGIVPGDVIAIQLPNWYEGAVSQLAAVLCGAVLLPIVQIYGSFEMKYILADSNAKLLFIPGDVRGRYFPEMLGELQQIASLETVIVVHDEPVANTIAYEDLFARTTASYVEPTVEPDNLALIVYTSGTTGEAKGAEHSSASLLNEVYSLEPWWSARMGEFNLGVFPSGHIAGLLSLLRLVIVGSPTVIMDRWDHVRAAQLVDEYAITSSVGATIHLAGLLDARDAGIASLETLRDYLVGGASVPSSIIARAEEAGIIAYRSWGMTEYPTATMGKPSETFEQRAFTDGSLAPGTQLRIVDDDGKDVPMGEEGELCLRGPELFRGYHGDRFNEGAFLEGGWFRTGDIGRIDAENFVTITDRKKDLIIRGAENISSKEVEDILSTHKRVAEVAAIGLPDERYGERVCIFVVTTDGEPISLEEVTAHFQHAEVARQKFPEKIILATSLPRTPFGKVQKTVLRAQLRDEA